jgi:hypothetical protein
MLTPCKWVDGMEKHCGANIVVFVPGEIMYWLVDGINRLVPVRSAGTSALNKGILPKLDEFCFHNSRKKILENSRCFVPNFINGYCNFYYYWCGEINNSGLHRHSKPFFGVEPPS